MGKLDGILTEPGPDIGPISRDLCALRNFHSTKLNSYRSARARARSLARSLAIAHVGNINAPQSMH